MIKSSAITILEFNTLISKYSKHLSKFDLKYSNGKCSFVGSNSFYTGGIYFSAITSMRSGCDQAHIFAHKDSVQALKSYSPDLIIHNSFDDNFTINSKNNNFALLDKFDTVSIGTCLGKQDYAKDIISSILKNINNDKCIFIFDADAISFVIQEEIFDQIKKMNHIFVFTPNNFEYLFLLNHYLKKEILVNEILEKITTNYSIETNIMKEFLKYIREEYLQNYNSKDYLTNIYKDINLNYNNEDILKINVLEVFESYLIERNSEIKIILDLSIGAFILSSIYNKIFVIKGFVDVICYKENVILVKNQGSFKRCGGIGDILVGIISGFTTSMLKKDIINCNDKLCDDFIKDKIIEVLAISCYYCKYVSNITYNDKGLSMIASDIIKNINTKF